MSSNENQPSVTNYTEELINDHLTSIFNHVLEIQEGDGPRRRTLGYLFINRDNELRMALVNLPELDPELAQQEITDANRQFIQQLVTDVEHEKMEQDVTVANRQLLEQEFTDTNQQLIEQEVTPVDQQPIEQRRRRKQQIDAPRPRGAPRTNYRAPRKLAKGDRNARNQAVIATSQAIDNDTTEMEDQLDVANMIEQTVRSMQVEDFGKIEMKVCICCSLCLPYYRRHYNIY